MTWSASASSVDGGVLGSRRFLGRWAMAVAVSMLIAVVVFAVARRGRDTAGPVVCGPPVADYQPPASGVLVHLVPRCLPDGFDYSALTTNSFGAASAVYALSAPTDGYLPGIWLSISMDPPLGVDGGIATTVRGHPGLHREAAPNGATASWIAWEEVPGIHVSLMGVEYSAAVLHEVADGLVVVDRTTWLEHADFADWAGD